MEYTADPSCNFNDPPVKERHNWKELLKNWDHVHRTMIIISGR